MSKNPSVLELIDEYAPQIKGNYIIIPFMTKNGSICRITVERPEFHKKVVDSYDPYEFHIETEIDHDFVGKLDNESRA